MIPRWLLKIKLIAIATILLVIISNHNVLKAEQKLNNPDGSLFPLAKVHPLPISLAKWKDTQNQGDYFTQIKPTPLGYLIWSQFPIKIYLAQPTELPDNSASSLRQQQWLATVRKAIAEWSLYLPLQEIDNLELADIIMARSTPEREVKFNPATGLYDIPRAIAAQTSYQFYWQDHKILSHRMTVKVSPNLSQSAILAATRHEIGHALGIWGHSPYQNDALYFSQVRDFPPISARDINTLKKIYQQPTRLGWYGHFASTPHDLSRRKNYSPPWY